MKLTQLAILFIVLSVSCGEPKHENSYDAILSFIPGVYVRSFKGEFSIGKDTLIINRPAARNNYYTIQHNGCYRRIKDKRLLEPKCKSETWIGIYDEANNVLIEQKHGKLISFIRDENVLLLGSSRFNKMK
jgi:hypothetical protein